MSETLEPVADLIERLEKEARFWDDQPSGDDIAALTREAAASLSQISTRLAEAREAAFEEAAQIADGWEHTRAGQEIADAIRSRAVKGAGQS